MKVKELNIEVLEIKVWTKPYNQIVIPKGQRLIKFSELIFIWENGKYRHILFKEWIENPKWLLFWLYPVWNYPDNSFRACLYWDGNWYADVDYLGGSYDNGKIIFCRSLNG